MDKYQRAFLSVIGQTRREIDDLEDLGTSTKVAQYLEHLQCGGEPKTANLCPLTKLIRKRVKPPVGRIAGVFVDRYRHTSGKIGRLYLRVQLYMPSKGNPRPYRTHFLDLPPLAVRFVNRFDRGEFPYLVSSE